MAWPKAGPGRPRGKGATEAARRIAKRVRAKTFRRMAAEEGYDPKLVPFEVLQRALDGETLPDGKPITAAQIERAKDLLPFTMPKLQAVAITQPPPPTPRAQAVLRGASLDTLQMLRDALALALDEAGRQIDGALADGEA
jgi:hypothetical protein